MDDSMISNISYTNKDFQTVYPELLDLVKKLTNKWDPSLSNESDPGVILLKLNALIADKNNYNIDKNVLECFPTSVTQPSNARRLYDSLGYRMHWYRSATTSIGLQLKSTDNIDGFKIIDQFTMLTDTTGEITYTLTQDILLSTAAKQVAQVHYGNAIEGRVKDFTVNNVDSANDISLDNLDSDLRLYFTDLNVAENGIFIKRSSDSSWNAWTRVDNLASQPLNSMVYEFGVVPNGSACYIQFPEDISTLMGDSDTFRVKYILSSGEAGNIKANVIRAFYDDITGSEDSDGNTQVINNQIRIVQAEGTLDGADPEDLDLAYKNYKRTIGTFNTLVTRRDYENYLYNLQYNQDYLVSNCVVSDRTNDLNKSLSVQVWSPNYNIKQVAVINNSSGQPALNAYDIVLYALSAGDGTYDSTFEATEDENIVYILNSSVDDVKAIEHDFEIPLNFDTSTANAIYYIYKNLYKLTGSLVTYSKVTAAEASEIEQNVMDALMTRYNARNVSFGEEPDYTDLIDTIQKADSRIKTVALNIPKFQVYHETRADSSESYTDESGTHQYDPISTPTAKEKLRIVAKMILSGNVQLFKFDTDFNYDFGIDEVAPIGSDTDPIYSITTSANIDLELSTTSETNQYEIQPNEYIQLYGPNYVATKEYSTYVKFNFYSANTSTSESGDGSTILTTSAKIPANTDYVLKVGELIKLRYTDSNGVVQIDDIGAGNIINCSIDVDAQPVESLSVTDGLVAASHFKYTLVTGQTLTVKELNKTDLKPGTKVYFILNNSDNTLRISSSDPYILQENEYFLYTNTNTDELFVWGSGTMISCDSESIFELSVPKYDSLNDLTSQNINSISWYQLNGVTVSGTELDIITLGYGSKIKIEVNEEDSPRDGDGNLLVIPVDYSGLKLSNTPELLQITDDDGGIIAYLTATIEDSTGATTSVSMYADKDAPNGQRPYWILSRLSLNVTEDSPQTLYGNQSITFYGEDGSEIESIVGDNSDLKLLNFSDSVILSGGEKLDAVVLNYSGNYEYALKAYYYKNNSISLYRKTNDSTVDANKTYYTLGTDGYTFEQFNGGSFASEVDYYEGSSILRNNGVLTLSAETSRYSLVFSFNNDDSINDSSYGWLIQTRVNISTENFAVRFSTQGLDGDNTGTYKSYYLTTFNGSTNTASTGFSSTGSYVLFINNNFYYHNLTVEFGTLSVGEGNSTVFTPSIGSSFDSVAIGSIRRMTGLNKDEINVKAIPNENDYSLYDEFDVTETETVGDIAQYKIINDINTLLANSTPKLQFDWSYVVPDSDKVLQPTASASYWNSNHCVNMYTIPQINFSKDKDGNYVSDIKVNPYSIQS